MKIGILTVYFADYGSFFHTAGLYKYLESQGHDCELIHESLRYKVSKRLAVSSLFEKMAPNFIKKAIGYKVTAFNTYMILKKDLKQYKISPKCKSVKEIEKRYDCIIVGSDELWSSTNKTIRYIPDYFGINISIPHFSYSTSGITMQFPNNEEINIKNGLMTFKCLAVRDYITAEWVKKLTNREPTIVLDPALLFPYYKASPEQELSATPAANEEKFIIVYGEHFSDEQIEWIKHFASCRKWALYSIAWRHSWCDRHLDINAAYELQKAFGNAEHCMSSTFHGTVFAIVNEVPFTCFLSKLRGKKIVLLLEEFHLTHCIYSDEMSAASEIKIDYDAVNRKLAERRKESETYLLDSLRMIEREIK